MWNTMYRSWLKVILGWDEKISAPFHMSLKPDHDDMIQFIYLYIYVLFFRFRRLS